MAQQPWKGLFCERMLYQPLCLASPEKRAALRAGKDGADAPPLTLRLRFLSPGCCLTVFSLCFLLLSVLLPCCSCFSGFLSIKVKSINSLMAPSGSPALPGRRAPLR